MTSKAEGINQLENADLLAIGIRCSRSGYTTGRQTTLITGNVLELLTNGSVGNIGAFGVFDTRQLIEIITPFLWNRVGIDQISFK